MQPGAFADAALALQFKGLYDQGAACALPVEELSATVVDAPLSGRGAATWDAAFLGLEALQRLHMVSGGLAELKCRSTGRRAVARLYAASTSGATAAACISLTPLLACNLGLACQLHPCLSQSADPSQQHELVEVRAAGPQLQHGTGPAAQAATSVRIARVPLHTTNAFTPGSAPPSGASDREGAASDAGAGEADAASPPAAAAQAAAQAALAGEAERQLLQQLRSYFLEAPRWLAPGQLLGVMVPPADGLPPPAHPPPRCGGAEGCAGGGDARAVGTWPQRPVLFRVLEVEPSGRGPLLVDPDTCQLILAGGSSRGLLPVGFQGCAEASTSAVTHDAAPSSVPPLLGIHARAAWHPAPGLPGVSGPLQPSWRRIAALVAPLLHASTLGTEVRTAVLLLGPRGCGKQTAARAAAAALGLNFVCVNCMELQGTSDERTAAALEALGAEASRVAPCLLLLRHLPCLADGAGAGGGSGGAQGQPSAGLLRIAAALQQLVDTHGSASARSVVLSPGGETAAAAAPSPPAAGAGGATVAPAALPPGLVVVVGTAANREDVPLPLGRCFSHLVEVDPLPRGDYVPLLTALLASAGDAGVLPSEVDRAAAQMVGLLPRDVAGVVADALAAAAAEQLEVDEYLPPPSATAAATAGVATPQAAGGEAREVEAGGGDGCGGVCARHLWDAVARVKTRTATEIGAPQVPDVSWEDVGGLEDTKRAILDTVELPLKRRELFAGGLRRRSGVLLYGPPGSGKTLLAKAVASQCAANFLSVKGPELINMYVGESERQVREVFARARRARPCVLFFDELDSLAPARGASGDAGGVMDRVVAQLLAEIDGVQGGSEDLFIIGATNRPDLLDPALLRPGRLDTLLYIGVAQDALSKLKVLRALTRRFALAPDVDLEALAERCPATLTGADLYALCADAWMTALKRIVAEGGGGGDQDGGGGEDGGVGVAVCAADFSSALAALTPSLSQAELARYLALRDHYEGRQQGHGGGAADAGGVVARV